MHTKLIELKINWIEYLADFKNFHVPFLFKLSVCHFTSFTPTCPFMPWWIGLGLGIKKSGLKWHVEWLAMLFISSFMRTEPFVSTVTSMLRFITRHNHKKCDNAVVTTCRYCTAISDTLSVCILLTFSIKVFVTCSHTSETCWIYVIEQRNWPGT